jgi:lipopolysaccharide assembly protein A
MTQPPAPHGPTITVPPPSANGSSSPPPAVPPPAVPPPAAPAQAAQPRSTPTRISGLRTGLIAAAAGLVIVMIFIIQNAHAVNISFLGAHLRLSLAVALVLAAIGGALLMAAAGTARITQLRRIIRRDRRKPQAS